MNGRLFVVFLPAPTPRIRGVPICDRVRGGKYVMFRSLLGSFVSEGRPVWSGIHALGHLSDPSGFSFLVLEIVIVILEGFLGLL